MEEEPDAEVLHRGGHNPQMGGIIMKRIKTLEVAASAAFVIGFFLVCGGGDLKTVLIGLPIFAFAAWGLNRVDKAKEKEAGR